MARILSIFLLAALPFYALGAADYTGRYRYFPRNECAGAADVDFNFSEPTCFGTDKTEWVQCRAIKESVDEYDYKQFADSECGGNVLLELSGKSSACINHDGWSLLIECPAGAPPPTTAPPKPAPAPPANLPGRYRYYPRNRCGGVPKVDFNFTQPKCFGTDEKKWVQCRHVNNNVNQYDYKQYSREKCGGDALLSLSGNSAECIDHDGWSLLIECPGGSAPPKPAPAPPAKRDGRYRYYPHKRCGGVPKVDFNFTQPTCFGSDKKEWVQCRYVNNNVNQYDYKQYSKEQCGGDAPLSLSGNSAECIDHDGWSLLIECPQGSVAPPVYSGRFRYFPEKGCKGDAKEDFEFSEPKCFGADEKKWVQCRHVNNNVFQYDYKEYTVEKCGGDAHLSLSGNSAQCIDHDGWSLLIECNSDSGSTQGSAVSSVVTAVAAIVAMCAVLLA